MLLLLPILSTVAAFCVGRAWGFSAGHEEGWHEGREQGWQDGYQAGHARAKEEFNRPARMEMVAPVGVN